MKIRKIENNSTPPRTTYRIKKEGTQRKKISACCIESSDRAPMLLCNCNGQKPPSLMRGRGTFAYLIRTNPPSFSGYANFFGPDA
jgi:hypothetical protein